MSYGVGHRCSSDLVWMWLWCRPAATALIQSLAWELPCAAGVALKKKAKKKKKKKPHKKTPKQQNTPTNTIYFIKTQHMGEEISNTLEQDPVTGLAEKGKGE